jgi:hypothetical protein
MTIISLTHVAMCHALKPHSNLLMTKALVGAIELSIKETLLFGQTLQSNLRIANVNE